jgi:tRNA(adenine34) deaminase
MLSHYGEDRYFMEEALKLSRRAMRQNEVPVGAVIVRAGEIIARSFNQVELLHDATAHAEMLAITQAEEAVGDWRLNECVLYVTKEPCPMCAGALVLARMGRVVFGAHDPKMGAAGGWINLLHSTPMHHQCEVTGGVLAEECGDILRQFFKQQRLRPPAPSASTSTIVDEPH